MVRLHNARKERVQTRVLETKSQAKKAAAEVESRAKAILIAKKALTVAEEAHEQANAKVRITTATVVYYLL